MLMYTHIVLWKIGKEPKEDIRAELKKRLEELENQIPGIVSMEIGFGDNPNGFDVCLNSVFFDKAAHDSYQTHPAHILVKEYVHSVVCERAVIDYESDT